MPEKKENTYRLLYFDSEGKAEPIRLIFHYFKTEYEDARLSREDWADRKPDTPFETLPIMEINGGKKTLGDSVAIARFLSKTLGEGFIGKTKTDAAKADMFVYATLDIFTPMYLVKFAEDDEKRAAAMDMMTKSIQRYFRCLEKHLRGHEAKFVVGGLMTWADIYVMYGIHAIEGISHDLIDVDEYPHVIDYYRSMRGHPRLKEYVDDRWPTALELYK